MSNLLKKSKQIGSKIIGNFTINLTVKLKLFWKHQFVQILIDCLSSPSFGSLWAGKASSTR